jgi:hypothetical protein
MNDRDLARIAEGAEVRAWTDMARAVTPELAESIGLKMYSVAGGAALVASKVASSLYNRAFGFGIDSPMDEATLDRTLALYRRDLPFTIQPSPFARPETVRASLERRGLVSRFNWIRWVRDASDPPAAATTLAIRPARRDEADTFIDLASVIFKEPPEVMPWFALTIGREGWIHYLALDGEAPVGIAALYVEDKIGWLGWGGTLTSHRGRGGQSAMIARRIADARSQGCEWVSAETADDLPEKPNPSYRNMRRAGFRLLFKRPSHKHNPPEPPAA